jgi:hypothetical protein
MTALVDNDILLKGACYRLLATLVAMKCGTGRVGYLAAARFVLSKKIGRGNLRGNAAEAEAELLNFLAEHEAIETTAEEQALAATLETAAQSLPVNLDTGESQLLAVLVLRTLPGLLTGDKRAIIAIERLLDATAGLSEAAGKVTCLEQLVKLAILGGDPIATRTAICKEPEVDLTLSICFSCFSPDVTTASILEGIDSYVSDLRRKAPRALTI